MTLADELRKLATEMRYGSMYFTQGRGCAMMHPRSHKLFPGKRRLKKRKGTVTVAIAAIEG